jgi:hypothetical protein
MFSRYLLPAIVFALFLVSEGTAHQASTDRYLFPLVVKMNATPILVKPDEVISLRFQLANVSENPILLLSTSERSSVEAIQIDRSFDLEIPDLSINSKNIINQWPPLNFASLDLSEGNLDPFSSRKFPVQEMKFRFSKRGKYLVRILVHVGLENGTTRFSQIAVKSNWVPVAVSP